MPFITSGALDPLMTSDIAAAQNPTPNGGPRWTISPAFNAHNSRVNWILDLTGDATPAALRDLEKAHEASMRAGSTRHAPDTNWSDAPGGLLPVNSGAFRDAFFYAMQTMGTDYWALDKKHVASRFWIAGEWIGMGRSGREWSAGRVPGLLGDTIDWELPPDLAVNLPIAAVPLMRRYLDEAQRVSAGLLYDRHGPGEYLHRIRITTWGGSTFTLTAGVRERALHHARGFDAMDRRDFVRRTVLDDNCGWMWSGPRLEWAPLLRQPEKGDGYTAQHFLAVGPQGLFVKAPYHKWRRLVGDCRTGSGAQRTWFATRHSRVAHLAHALLGDGTTRADSCAVMVYRGDNGDPQLLVESGNKLAMVEGARHWLTELDGKEGLPYAPQ